MKIKNLAATSLEDIVSCLSSAFENYFVQMPSDVNFWRDRFTAARVDYGLSFGAFDDGKLVGFILHGIDIHNNTKTAFNTGTGVLEAYRGNQLVDKMYAKAFPMLKIAGIQKCMLEVIAENHKAIRVYERIGFNKSRFLKCFRGTTEAPLPNFQIEKTTLNAIKTLLPPFQKFYSWDNSNKAIEKSSEMFDFYLVQVEEGIPLGYFIINNRNNALIQIERLTKIPWEQLIVCANKIVPTIKITNIASEREDLTQAFETLGLENYINQYEMEMNI